MPRAPVSSMFSGVVFKDYNRMSKEVSKREPADSKAEEAQASPQRRRETRRLRRAEYAYAAGLAAFAVLAVLAKANAYFSWDLRVATAVQSISLPGMETFMRVISLPGNGVTSWAVVIVVALTYFPVLSLGPILEYLTL